MYREQVLTALFALASGATGFTTVARRLVPPSKAVDIPALYLVTVRETFLPHGTSMGMRTARELPQKRQIECEMWIYTDGGIGNPSPETQQNGALDAIEDALKPSVMSGVQTLGLDIVSHCWIEGEVKRPPVVLDGIAIAVVPVKILLK